MDTQTIIDTATAATATVLGATEASTIFRTNLKNARKVNLNLTPAQRNILKSWVDYDVIFVGGSTPTNDHPVMVAARNLCREELEMSFQISTTAERTLIVGASHREVSKYINNPQIHYMIYGGENKDYDRVIRPMLSAVCRKLGQLSRKKCKVTKMPSKEDPERQAPRRITKRYNDATQVYEDYILANKMPSNIHVDYVECNTLVFEDSIYNFTKEDVTAAFDKTNANVAYGYAVLPLELVFPNMAENEVYTVTREGDYTHLTYKYGYCNGYTHKTAAWETLLKNVAWTCGKTTLAVEITSRVGPLAVFKIYRCRHPERLVRDICIPKSQVYVRALNLEACTNYKTGKISYPLTYFSVLADEYLDAYTYAMSLDIKSVTFENILIYIRRKSGGISLVTKELTKAWALPTRHHTAFALLIYIMVLEEKSHYTNIVDNIAVGSWIERVKAAFRSGTAKMLPWLTALLDWLAKGNLIGDLVKWENDYVRQTFEIKMKEYRENFRTETNAVLTCDNEYDGDIPNCPVCYRLMDKLGEQIVECKHKPGSQITFSLTDDELMRFRTQLIDNDNDPLGLKTVKERAKANLPTSGFEHKCLVRYIRAGPGTGKSYLIKQLATPADLVLAPFTKLKPDYEGLVDAVTGDKYDLDFKTTHRAMDSRGKRVVFVDEFTSLPYEILACVLKNNGAEEVWLVGDERQTRVREPDEGIYIGNRVPLEEICTHELIKNFRNPKDTVALLNKFFGYNMVATSKIEKSIEYKTIDQIDSNLTAKRLAFSHGAAATYTENPENTIRSSQGGTFENVVLYVTEQDGALVNVPELQIVGMSRHKSKLTIVLDNSAQALQFKTKFALDQDFYREVESLVTKLPEKIEAHETMDPVVCKILPHCFIDEDPMPIKEDHFADSDSSGYESSTSSEEREAVETPPDNEQPTLIPGTDDNGNDCRESESPRPEDDRPQDQNENVSGNVAQNPENKLEEIHELYVQQEERNKIILDNLGETGIANLQHSLRTRVRGETRAFFKLKEMLESESVSFTVALDLCAGPGGFTRALSAHKADSKIWFHEYKLAPPNFNMKFDRTRAKPLPLSDNNKGDLLTKDFEEIVAKSKGVTPDLITADGAMHSEDYDRERINLRLISKEWELISKSLTHNGTMIIKVFTCVTVEMTSIIGEICESFETVKVLKPKDSSVVNTERYIIAKGFMKPPQTPLSKVYGQLSGHSLKMTKALKSTSGRKPADSSKGAVPKLRQADNFGGQCSSMQRSQKAIERPTHDFEALYLSDSVVELRSRFKESVDFLMQVELWLQDPGERIKLKESRDLDVVKQIHWTQTPKDCYLIGKEFLPNATMIPEITALNEAHSAIVKDAFNTGKTSADSLIAPINARGHPVRMEKTYYSASAGLGNHYCAKNTFQTLQVLQTRYFNAQTKYGIDRNAELLADEIVDLWFSECVRPDYTRYLWDTAEIQVILSKYYADLESKNYDKAYVGQGGCDNPTGRTIRFNLKDIFKPKIGIPDLTKAGQGISAWNVSACSAFCGVFRCLTYMVSKIENDNVITDAYTDELSFIKRVSTEFKKTPKVSVNAITDGECFDANQNEFTQLLEKKYWRKMGVSEQFLDHYYSFRKSYLVVSTVGSGVAGTQKTSGEPGTLVNNGVVSKLISNYLVRGEGPWALVYKGDDFAKRQCNLVLDVERQKRIDALCPLRLRVNISNGADFCGLIYNGEDIFPSLPRKLIKILAHRYRDYEHFCEYQTSLRDFVERINVLDETKVVACNADLKGCSFEEMNMVLNMIKSFSHINREQFFGYFDKQTEKYYVPRLKGDGVVVDFL